MELGWLRGGGRSERDLASRGRAAFATVEDTHGRTTCMLLRRSFTTHSAAPGVFYLRLRLLAHPYGLLAQPLPALAWDWRLLIQPQGRWRWQPRVLRIQRSMQRRSRHDTTTTTKRRTTRAPPRRGLFIAISSSAVHHRTVGQPTPHAVQRHLLFSTLDRLSPLFSTLTLSPHTYLSLLSLLSR